MDTCIKVLEYTLCGKEARRFIAKDFKSYRRRRLLKRLIKEVRELRKLNATLR